MVKKTKKKISKHYGLVVLAVCVAVSAALVLPWMIVREVHLAETKSVRENAENIVINNVGATNGLVNAILAEKSGCPELDGSKNVTYIVKEAGNFALTQYGCALDAKMFYKKVDGKWKSLSPTNNFINGQPLCSHLKEHSISSNFVSLCYDNAGIEGQEPQIIANPVK